MILDATAFYAGIPFLGPSTRNYTTGEVFDEVMHIKRSHEALDALIASGNLIIMEPEPRYLVEAKDLARGTGDITKMSAPDISVVALALQHKASGEDVSIVTDDNAVANVAAMSGIKVSPVMGRGIRKAGRWVRYCSACGGAYGGGQRTCQICGNRLRMKLRAARPRKTAGR